MSSGGPTTIRCPSCGGSGTVHDDGRPVTCSTCDQLLDRGHFSARGAEAMKAQTDIIADYNRAITLRAIAAYSTSVLFALISAALIVFAPEHRATAANLVAAAFLVLAVGIAGFTRFKAKAPAIEIEADGRSS